MIIFDIDGHSLASLDYLLLMIIILYLKTNLQTSMGSLESAVSGIVVRVTLVHSKLC